MSSAQRFAGDAEKCFALGNLTRVDSVEPGETVICWHEDLQRFSFVQETEVESGGSLFAANEGGVDTALLKGHREAGEKPGW